MVLKVFKDDDGWSVSLCLEGDNEVCGYDDVDFQRVRAQVLAMLDVMGGF